MLSRISLAPFTGERFCFDIGTFTSGLDTRHIYWYFDKVSRDRNRHYLSRRHIRVFRHIRRRRCAILLFRCDYFAEFRALRPHFSLRIFRRLGQPFSRKFLSSTFLPLGRQYMLIRVFSVSYTHTPRIDISIFRQSPDFSSAAAGELPGPFSRYAIGSSREDTSLPVSFAFYLPPCHLRLSFDYFVGFWFIWFSRRFFSFFHIIVFEWITLFRRYFHFKTLIYYLAASVFFKIHDAQRFKICVSLSFSRHADDDGSKMPPQH